MNACGLHYKTKEHMLLEVKLHNGFLPVLINISNPGQRILHLHACYKPIGCDNRYIVQGLIQGVDGVSRPEGIMLQKSSLFYSEFPQKSLHYAHYYSFYAPHCVIILFLVPMIIKFTSY